MSEEIVKFEDVSLKFGKHEVHKSLNFNIARGEVVTIMGPSGTGKTVILKMIIGLLRATSGKITVMGQEISNLSEEELWPIRSKIGMLFQGAALFDSLNVYENVAYALREKAEAEESKIKSIVEEKLSIVGLEGIDKKFPPQLSGGQKKRVGLARALASSPEAVLFDEPTTGLDPTAVRLIDDLILKLKRNHNITSIVVTHDIESARRVSDRWIFLTNGIVVAEGPVKEIAEKSNEVNQFITGNWDEDDHHV